MFLIITFIKSIFISSHLIQIIVVTLMWWKLPIFHLIFVSSTRYFVAIYYNPSRYIAVGTDKSKYLRRSQQCNVMCLIVHSTSFCSNIDCCMVQAAPTPKVHHVHTINDWFTKLLECILSMSTLSLCNCISFHLIGFSKNTSSSQHVCDPG